MKTEELIAILRRDFQDGLGKIFIEPKLISNNDLVQIIRFFLMGGLVSLQATGSVHWMRYAEAIKPLMLGDFDPTSWRP